MQQQYNNLLPCSVLIRDATNPMNFTLNAGTNLKVTENAYVVTPISTEAAKTHFQLVKYFAWVFWNLTFCQYMTNHLLSASAISGTI